MLKSKTLLSVASALGITLFAIGGAAGSSKAEILEYRFVVNSSTSSGSIAALDVPVRAPFEGFKSAFRICFEAPSAAVADVQIKGPQGALGLVFEAIADYCAVSEEIDFSRSLSFDGTNVVVEVRLTDDSTATFLVPMAVTSPYLSTEYLAQVSAAKLGTVTGVFPANPVTNRTKNVVLCAAGNQTLTEAKLWMPAHGHGSTATTLTRRTDGCYLVDRLNFVMTGTWELRTLWSDGTAATLSFSVIGAM